MNSFLGAFVLGMAMVIGLAYALATSTADMAPADRLDFQQALLVLDDPRPTTGELARADTVLERARREVSPLRPGVSRACTLAVQNHDVASRLASPDEIGVGIAQVGLSLGRDSPVKICTDALKMFFYAYNSFHEDILPYRHCWQKAINRNDSLRPLDDPQHGYIRSELCQGFVTPPPVFIDNLVGCYALGRKGADVIKVGKSGQIYNLSLFDNGQWHPAGDMGSPPLDRLTEWLGAPMMMLIEDAAISLHRTSGSTR